MKVTPETLLEVVNALNKRIAECDESIRNCSQLPASKLYWDCAKDSAENAKAEFLKLAGE